MSRLTRISIAFISLLLAFIYTFPTLSLYFAFFTVWAGKYIAGIMCFVFAWNIAKVVQSYYEKSVGKNNETHASEPVQEGRGYAYSIKDDKITFTFRDIQDRDGRQLSRLKFMREKFFNDERN